MENLRYSIGLDIGIASVGWAAVLLDEMDRPNHILDMNVRIFTEAEESKKGESLAKPSRDFRSQRRRNSRKKLRISDIKYLFEQNHLISQKEFEARYYKKGLPDVYYLRTKALDERISDEELAQVLLHIAIHRGFKSNRKSETKEDENGKVVALLDYPEVAPGVVNFAHTEVDPSLGGQGIAAKITEAAAERLRREGLKAELSCSYSIRWFSKHPEYADVLADPEGEAIKAAALAGPACGIRRP